ncbi:fluoride efflux transporter CrcB [soil metagenome]
MSRGQAPLAVAAGGIIGTGLRLGLDTLLPHSERSFPVSILIVNTLGSFLLGLLVSTAWRRASTPSWLKAGLGAGLLGSFTTFSALTVSLVAQSASGEWMPALVTLAASLLLGFGAAALGLRLGGREPAPIDEVDE